MRNISTLWLFVVALIAAPCSAAENAAYTAALSKTQAAHRTLAERWYAALDQSKPSPSPQLLRLQLPKFAGNAALRTELPLGDGFAEHASAWIVDKQLFWCPADAEKLTITADAVKGSLTVTLPPEFESGPAASKRVADLVGGKENLPPLEPEQVAIAIEGTIADGRVTGTFTFAAARTKGAIAGELVNPSAAAPNARNLGAIDTKRLFAPEQYAMAAALERDTFEMYRQLRALAAAGNDRSKYSGGYEQAAIPIPLRPAFIKQKPAAAQPATRPRGGKRPPAKATPKGPSIDDVTEDAPPPKLEPDIVATLAQATKSRQPIIEAMAAATWALAIIVDHAQAADPGPVQRGKTFDDPLFGPRYGSDSLAPGKATTNRLPASAGEPGTQDWPFVHAWQCVGPFHLPPLSWDPLRLPDAMPIASTEYAGKESDVKWLSAAISAAGCAVFTDLDAYSEAPDLEEQPTLPATRPAVRLATYYGATTIEAEREVELIMAAGCGGRMAIWLNNQLIARGPTTDNPTNIAQEALIFTAKFKKGVNKLLVRAETPAFGLFNHRRPGTASYFWMRACTRGAPADAKASQATLSAVAARKRDLPNLPANIRGFRGDQTGNFAEADPPTAWDIDRRINVLWTTPIERWSKASPVVVGEKVFVCADPHTLVCLDASTGKLLWRKSANVLELINPAAREASEKLYQEYLDAQAALAPKLAELGSDYAARVRALAAKGLEMPRVAVALREMSQDAEKKFRAFMNHLRGNTKLIAPAWDGSYNGPWLGYTFATPVTDGKLVYVQFRTGATAAFDLDGKRVWMVHTPYEAGGSAVCSSPVLADGKLVIARSLDPKREGALLDLTALDAASGKTVWSTQADSRSQTSTPVVMRLTNGQEDMTVIATDGGTVIRADDGKILIPGMRGGCGTGSPTPVGDFLYRVQNTQAGGVQLVMLDRDHVGAKWLWSNNAMYNAIYAGLGHRDGTLLGICHGGSQAISERGLYLISTETGLPIDRPFNLDARQKKQGIFAYGRYGFVPPVATKRGIYLAVRGQGHASSLQEELPNRWTPYTYITVAQHGALGRFIAHNKVMSLLTPHPTPAGDRLYIRNDHELMCVGYTGDEGRAYEAEVNAATILDDITDDPPADAQAAAIWTQGIAHARPFLEKVIALKPDCPAAKRAKGLLAKL